jgi:hypothetical protein
MADFWERKPVAAGAELPERIRLGGGLVFSSPMW